MGAISNILNILREISLGEYYFEIALLLRQSMFMSTTLLNSETWLGLSKENIDELEKIDQILLKRVFEAPATTSIKSLYLESGCYPIRFHIKARCIMFLYYLLNRNEDELISKIFWAQKDNPTKNDWYSTVMKDLAEFGLDFLELTEIKSMKKDTFKKTVKEKCKELAMKYLLEDNEQKSKLKNFKYYQLQLQPYLTSKEISTRQKKILYRFRTRMVHVGKNYGKKVKCPLCKKEDDTQEHLFECVILKIK